MIINRVIAFAMLCLAPIICSAEVAINSVITLKPGNPDMTVEKLIDRGKLMKGYFVSKSEQSVVLKIPHASAGKMQQFIESNWLIYQQHYQAKNVTAEMIDMKSRLKAKEELVGEYKHILASASADKIVIVATEVAKLVEEIELLRGEKQLLQHQIQFATLTINFRLSRDRFNRQNLTSSFDWLNTLGLENLLREFAQ